MQNNRQILFVIAVSGWVQGFTQFDSQLLPLDYIASNRQLAVIHPYLDRVQLLPKFALYRHRLVDLAGYGELLLREAGLSYRVEIVTDKKDQHLVDYRYRWQGHDICDLRASIHALRHGRQLYRRGQYPDIVAQTDDLFVWPHLTDIRSLVEETFSDAGRIIDRNRCLLSTSDGLIPVYDLTVKVNKFLYQLRVSAVEVLSVKPQFFHVQGEFFIHPENRIASEQRQNFYLEVVGDGFLHNRNFATAVYGRQRVRERDNVFNYHESDPRLAEVNAFAHANLMLRWFRGLGYRWQGEPLLIEVHANRSQAEIHAPIRQFPNNALYMPQTSNYSSQARIMIGDGDGVHLRDIPLDGDVVSHELGHHIIYRRLTETKGQSLIIHEGLADYFTFAKTGNACLAESVCPAGSPVCQRNGQCLRVGDHRRIYADFADLGSPHITGQILSAFLWDLRTASDMASSEVDRLAFKAIDYLQWNSDLRGFVEAVLLADYELYQGNNCSTILDAIVARGLAEFADNLTCNADTPKIIEYNRTSATADDNQVTANEQQDSCGTIVSTKKNSSPYALLLIISPLLLVIVSQRWRLTRYQ